MLAVALALVSAVTFGASDYTAGLATRASGVLQVTFLAQVTSLTVGLLIAPWVSPFRLSAAAAGWSATGGSRGSSPRSCSTWASVMPTSAWRAR